jgi:outer membrane protein assembly factor BamB
MSPFRTTHSVISVLALLFTSSAVASEWPNVHGVHMDGVSAETNIADSLSKEKAPPVVWKSSVGPGYAGISVSGGKLYTMGLTSGYTLGVSSTSHTNARLHFQSPCLEVTLYCFDTANGRLIWNYVYNVPSRFEIRDWRWRVVLSPDFAGPKSVPTIHQDRVYTYDHAGTLTCLDAKIGSPVWIAPARDQLDGMPPRYGYGASPVIHNDLVIVPVFSKSAGLAAYHRQTGRLVWKGGRTAGDSVWDGYSTPRVHQNSHGKQLIIFYTGGGLYALDPATGATVWEYPIKHSTREVVMSPVIHGNDYFVSSHYAPSSLRINVEVDRPKVVWENKFLKNHYGNLILSDGYLYGSSGYDKSCELKCVDFKTGEIRWSTAFQKDGNGPREQFQTILADGKLIMLTNYGELVLASAGPAKYIELGRAQIMSPEAQSWCPMALAGGLLYAKDSLGEIRCIDLRADKSPLLAEGDAKQFYRTGTITTVERKQKKTDWWREKLSGILGISLLGTIWISSNLVHARLMIRGANPRGWRFLAFLIGLPATFLAGPILGVRHEERGSPSAV